MHLPAQQRIRSDIKDRLKRLDRAPDPDAALGIFLDLNLEYEPLRDFKSLCVLIPDECLSTPASLYLRNRKGDLILRRTRSSGMKTPASFPFATAQSRTFPVCCACTAPFPAAKRNSSPDTPGGRAAFWLSGGRSWKTVSV